MDTIHGFVPQWIQFKFVLNHKGLHNQPPSYLKDLPHHRSSSHSLHSTDGIPPVPTVQEEPLNLGCLVPSLWNSILKHPSLHQEVTQTFLKLRLMFDLMSGTLLCKVSLTILKSALKCYFSFIFVSPVGLYSPAVYPKTVCLPSSCFLSLSY